VTQPTSVSQSTPRQWTFLSNHGHVLVCLALDPKARLRDVAASVGITERAVQKIVGDLEAAGVVVRQRSGRRNTYRLNGSVPLRHPLVAHRSVGTLLSLVAERTGSGRARTT
jgi:hypothetical protein